MAKVLSLVGGITCAILLAVYIHKEHSFENFIKDRDNIYRVTSSWQGENSIDAQAWTPNPVALFLKSELPEVETFVRILPTYKKMHLRNDSVSFLQENIYITDSAFFDLFPVRMIYGSPGSLGRTRTIIITKSLAERLYGKTDPTGQILTAATGWSLEIGGVMEDLPDNTHLKISAIVSWRTFSDFKPDENWTAFSYTYLKLHNSHNIAQVEQKLGTITQNSIVPAAAANNFRNFGLAIQPIKDIHLYSNLNLEMSAPANRAYLQMFMILAGFFLVIASFNFINIATATATARAKEIGLRKVHGAFNTFIRRQFLLESTIVVLFSVFLSAIAAVLLLPKFASIIETKLSFDLFDSPWSVALFVSLVVALTFISALYPAYVASRTNLSSVIKGVQGMEKGGRQFTVRKGIIVLQMAISTIAIIATGVIFSQMEYVSNKQLGFEKDNILVLTIPTTPNYPVDMAVTLENEFIKIPAVEKAGNSQLLIGMQPWRDKYSVEGKGDFKERTLTEVFVDYNFIDALGIEVIDGRNFDLDRPADFDDAAIINETLAREAEWSKPLGKEIKYGDIWNGKVIGVIKDFHVSSLHEKIEPMVIRLRWEKEARLDYLYLKINGSSDIKTTLSAIEARFKQLLPNFPFDFTFLDSRYEQLYKADAYLGDVLTLASLVMVLISCLGVLSLSTLMVQKRNKEVGVRKVLGAGPRSIVWLYLRGFVTMTLIGNVIAWPIVLWIMQDWLENFEYRTSINPVFFMIAAAIGIVVVVVIVGLHSIRLSRINPVKVLKAE